VCGLGPFSLEVALNEFSVLTYIPFSSAFKRSPSMISMSPCMSPCTSISHPSFSFLVFSNPTIKLQLGLQIGGRLLIAALFQGYRSIPMGHLDMPPAPYLRFSVQGHILSTSGDALNYVCQLQTFILIYRLTFNLLINLSTKSFPCYKPTYRLNLTSSKTYLRF
jgi:hypothetical protein